MGIELKHIHGINRHETRYLYEEIFVKEAYLRHGLSLPDDATVFDVGANIGLFSLFVGSRCPRATIFAFEPIPPIFEKLERNVRNIQARVQLFCCGISDIGGEASFTYYPGYSMMSGKAMYADRKGDIELVKQKAMKEYLDNSSVDNGFIERNLDDLLKHRFQEVSYQCRLRCISEVVDEYNVSRIDLLKIDVQRAEIDVLNGIRDEHWPIIRQLAMEVHDGSDPCTKGRLNTIAGILSREGFRIAVEQYEGLSGTDRHNLFAVRQPE